MTDCIASIINGNNNFFILYIGLKLYFWLYLLGIFLSTLLKALKIIRIVGVSFNLVLDLLNRIRIKANRQPCVSNI